MNKTNRKELKEALSLIEAANLIIESIKDDEQNKFDNLPEGIQCSKKGERFEEIVSLLEESIDQLSDVTENIRSTLE